MNEELLFKAVAPPDRLLFYEIWTAIKADHVDILDKEYQQYARFMKEHKEYYYDWENADSFREYDPDTDVNPFLHIMIHSVVENQLNDEDLPEVKKIYNRLIQAGFDEHDAAHCIGEALIYEIYEIMKKGKTFAKLIYIKNLKKISKKWMKKYL